jgi:hypothetical protein
VLAETTDRLIETDAENKNKGNTISSGEKITFWLAPSWCAHLQISEWTLQTQAGDRSSPSSSSRANKLKHSVIIELAAPVQKAKLWCMDSE